MDLLRGFLWVCIGGLVLLAVQVVWNRLTMRPAPAPSPAPPSTDDAGGDEESDADPDEGDAPFWAHPAPGLLVVLINGGSA
jgi:hypothetical protein